jgi:hypothetical protein
MALGIHPLKVLEHDDERLNVSLAQKEANNRVLRPLAAL